MTDPIAETLSVWPRLRDEAGLPGGAWEHAVLGNRQDSQTSRVVLAMQQGETMMVLKREIRPHRPEQFARTVETHLAAQDAFPMRPGLVLPRMLSAELETQSNVQSFVPGIPLADLVQQGPIAADLLERAGRWVSAFHEGLFRERRVFQPKYTIAQLDGLEAEVRAGKPVARKGPFLQAAAQLREMAAEYEGQGTVAALTHGDLNMRNLLIADDTVAGIDFAIGNSAPVGHDLSRLLIDYAALRGDEAAEGRVLPPEAEVAFFRGYTLTGAEDPSVAFLLRMRILVDWLTIPAQPGDRSPLQKRRMQGLKTLAARVFGV